jgi:hypothetical protein
MKCGVKGIVVAMFLAGCTTANSKDAFDVKDPGVRTQFRWLCKKEVEGSSRALSDQCIAHHVRRANLWIQCSNNGRNKDGVQNGVCLARKDPMHSIYNRCLRQGVKFGSQKMPACIKRGRVIEAEMIKRGL